MTKTLTIGLAVLLAAAAGNAVASEQVDSAYQALQAAQTSKDVAQIKKTALEVWRLADQEITQAPPAEADLKQAWASRVDYDRDIQVHAEYAIYAAAVTAPTGSAVDLFTALVQMSPKSKYLDQGYGYYFNLLEQAGQGAKVNAEAEKAVANFPKNPEALLVLANAALTHKQNDRALAYSKRLIAAVKTRPRPEGESDTQWEVTKSTLLGKGYWISGVVEGQKNQFFDANTDLRAALPLISGKDAMLGPAFFYLGVANYNLSRELLNRAQMQEAVKFSEKAAAIKSPVSQQAWENAVVMKAELAKWR